MRELGHAIAPSLVAPNRPGEFARQAIASIGGVKTEISTTPAQQIYQKATEFAKAHGYKADTGWIEEQTEEPSYSKLRSALRNGDTKEAASQLEALRKSHGGGREADRKILTAMKTAAKRPFTGSQKAERAFVNSLTDKELEDYRKAQQERQQEYERFVDWFSKLE
jgi:hypothetical protein